jgi:hypothetical protein
MNPLSVDITPIFLGYSKRRFVTVDERISLLGLTSNQILRRYFQIESKCKGVLITQVHNKSDYGIENADRRVR